MSKITGYRQLTEEEIGLMNESKALAIMVGEFTEKIKSRPATDRRWANIGITDLQKGFMALTRSIAQPETF